MSGTAIEVRGLVKYYKYYDREFDRVREIFSGRERFQRHYALQDVSLDVRRGEVLGIVGKNGAGKSTLLKVLSNTILPSAGQIRANGRITALLELGSGFHPDMTGHENIYLKSSILGLKPPQIDAIYEQVVAFSGVGEFIHRPVKTYSSGMFVRLAFAIATHVDPDILIIDEALSVGDGAFARKSFDRIMEFKDAGKTILFCSHSLYQVEALSDRVLWIERGRVRDCGEPAQVVTGYGETLDQESPRQESMTMERADDATLAAHAAAAQSPGGVPRILDIQVRADGHAARSLHVVSGETTLEVAVQYSVSDKVPPPSLGVAFTGGDGRILASVGTVNDNVALEDVDRSAGRGRAAVRFSAFPLLKGRYNVNVYLMCEKGVHVYEAVVQAAELNVQQKGLARGLVNLPHQWLS